MPPTGNAVQVEATLEDAFLLYLEKRQVIKMMFKYELKRFFKEDE